MKKHDAKKPLRLTMESIRNLEARELAAIAGGKTGGSRTAPCCAPAA
jgi:hypothetical protein